MNIIYPKINITKNNFSYIKSSVKPVAHPVFTGIYDYDKPNRYIKTDKTAMAIYNKEIKNEESYERRGILLRMLNASYVQDPEKGEIKFDKELYDIQKKLYKISDYFSDSGMYSTPLISFAYDKNLGGLSKPAAKLTLYLAKNYKDYDTASSNFKSLDGHCNIFQKISEFLEGMTLQEPDEYDEQLIEKFYEEINYLKKQCKRNNVIDAAYENVACCKDKDGKFNRRNHNYIRKLLERKDFNRAVIEDILSAVKDPETGIVSHNMTVGTDKLLDAGIKCDEIANAINICSTQKLTMPDENIQKYIICDEKKRQDLTLCKNKDGIITDESFNTLIKLQDVANDLLKQCINEGKVNHDVCYAVAQFKENFNYSDYIINRLVRILTQPDAVEHIKYNTAAIIKEVNKNKNNNDLSYKMIGLCIGDDGKFNLERINQNLRLQNAAKERRHLLINGGEELTDEDIKTFFLDNSYEIARFVDLAGEENFIYAFNYKMEYLTALIEKFSNIEPCQYLLELTNPKNTFKYKNLNSALFTAKENLKKAKSPEFIELENSTRESLSEIKEQVKSSDDKNLIKKLHAEAKALKSNLNALKTPEIIQAEKRVNGINFQLKNLLDNAIKDPQDVIAALQIFSAIYIYEEDISKLNPKTPEDRIALNNFLEKKIFDFLGIEYNKNIAEKMNFSKSRYLPDLFAMNRNCNKNLYKLACDIHGEPDKSLKELFDKEDCNFFTRLRFKERGIDYDKWCDVDKNSYVKVNVQTDIENSKQAAINNLEKDLNDEAFKKLPDIETDKIFAALKEHWYTAELKAEAAYDTDGILENTRCDTLHLCKNGKPIQYEDLEDIIKIIKKTINDNEFWSTHNKNAKIENSRDTVYNHLMKLRPNEIKNIALMHRDKETTLEVHKTDMNDIAHSLFLGNHAHCCTAVGSGCNQWSAPNYIKNKLTSCIEVMDGKEFVGNTMCFIAEVDGETSLYLDNIELAPRYQYNDKIRDAIFEYAKKFCAEIGKPDMPIYAGPHRHKCNMPFETLKERKIKIIGTSGIDELYIDYGTYNMEINDCRNDPDTVNLYKIR